MSAFNWHSRSSQSGSSQFGGQSTVNIDGQSLEYAAYGPDPANAPTIVMLHEGLGCVELWRGFPEQLAEKTGCGVFVYSRAGYGKSDPCVLPRPLDYMTREAMDVLPKVLDAIGFNHGILLGHSDGATIAAIYGGMSGDLRVRGLVLMAPHFFVEEEGLKSIADAKAEFERGGLRDRLAKYHEDVDCTFKGWNEAWLDPKFKNWNVADAIDYLRIPVLAIQGRQDRYGTMAQIEEIADRIYSPLDTEILEDCGHSPHLEQPVKTLDAASEFAKRLNRIESVQVDVANFA